MVEKCVVYIENFRNYFRLVEIEQKSHDYRVIYYGSLENCQIIKAAFVKTGTHRSEQDIIKNHGSLTGENLPIVGVDRPVGIDTTQLGGVPTGATGQTSRATVALEITPEEQKQLDDYDKRYVQLVSMYWDLIHLEEDQIRKNKLLSLLDSLKEDNQ